MRRAAGGWAQAHGLQPQPPGGPQAAAATAAAVAAWGARGAAASAQLLPPPSPLDAAAAPPSPSQQQQQQQQAATTTTREARYDTKRVKLCATWRQLARVVDVHGHRFNALNACAALVHLAQLSQRERPPQQPLPSSPVVGSGPHALSDFIDLPFGATARQQQQWAAAVDDYAAYEALTQRLLQMVLGHARGGRLQARQVANALWAAATLSGGYTGGHPRCLDLVEELLPLSQALLPWSNAQELSNRCALACALAGVLRAGALPGWRGMGTAGALLPLSAWAQRGREGVSAIERAQQSLLGAASGDVGGASAGGVRASAACGRWRRAAWSPTTPGWSSSSACLRRPCPRCARLASAPLAWRRRAMMCPPCNSP